MLFLRFFWGGSGLSLGRCEKGEKEGRGGVVWSYYFRWYDDNDDDDDGEIEFKKMG